MMARMAYIMGPAVLAGGGAGLVSPRLGLIVAAVFIVLGCAVTEPRPERGESR